MKVERVFSVPIAQTCKAYRRVSTLRIVTACTARKVPAGGQCAAEDLYLGQQHIRLMRGVHAYREAGQPAGALDLHILSALHGFVRAEAQLLSYDYSFSGQTAAAIRRRGRDLSVPEDARALLKDRSNLTVLLLSDPYLRACDLDETLSLGGPVLVFCSPAAARRLPATVGFRAILLANEEARRFACGLTSLKGELASRLLCKLAQDPSDLEAFVDPESDILALLMQSHATATGAGSV